MPFSKPTLDTIISRIESDLTSRISGASTFLRYSVLKILAKALGGQDHLIYEYLYYMSQNLFATTADTYYLELIGSEYGVTRNFGVKATGTVTASGTNGITIPAGTRLQSALGNVYLTNATIVIAGGTASLAITAEAVGSGYNEAAGVPLSFISPIIGVDVTAYTATGGIDNGVDEETDDDYRERVLSRKRQPPHGGAPFDYETWAKELSGITRAWAIPEYMGIGTVGLGYVMDGEVDIFPTEAQRNATRAYLVSHTDPVTSKTVGVPVTAEPGFFMIPLTALTVNFSIQIYPNNTAVQSAITSRLEDLMTQDGGPAQILAVSRMYEAISSAAGETRSRLVYPTSDVVAATNQVHVLGDVTFSDYS